MQRSTYYSLSSASAAGLSVLLLEGSLLPQSSSFAALNVGISVFFGCIAVRSAITEVTELSNAKTNAQNGNLQRVDRLSL